MKHLLLDLLAVVSIVSATGIAVIGWTNNLFVIFLVGLVCLVPGWSRLTRKLS